MTAIASYSFIYLAIEAYSKTTSDFIKVFQLARCIFVNKVKAIIKFARSCCFVKSTPKKMISQKVVVANYLKLFLQRVCTCEEIGKISK